MAWIPIGLAAAALMRGLSRRPRVAAVFGVLLVSFIVGLSAVPALAVNVLGRCDDDDRCRGRGVHRALAERRRGSPWHRRDAIRSELRRASTPSTVTTIQVNGTDGDESVTIDQSGSAPFPHQNTISIDLALGDGTDSLVIAGQSTADSIGFGADGISLDAGGTPDVTGIGTVESFTVDAGGGDDTVSGKEGGGLGGDFATALTIDGEVGNDALTGGDGDDEHQRRERERHAQGRRR